MPRELAGAIGAEPIAFDAFCAALDEHGCDLAHDEGVEAARALLAQLYANRDFLVERALDELETACSGQADNGYGAQVLMLHRAPGRHFVRANFWPAEDDVVLQSSGRRHYFYDVPHDHNFDFLTVGYLGPGYRSDWYEYDRSAVAGYPGEAVDLTRTECGTLSQGRMLLYRAHRDVHVQLPPTALSISINIVPEVPGTAWRDQFLFDIDAGRIAAVPTITASEIALAIAVTWGGEDAVEQARHVARAHPSPRFRWRAWAALVGSAGGDDQRAALLETAVGDPSPVISIPARHRLDLLAQKGPISVA
jgi:hypothetical protein